MANQPKGGYATAIIILVMLGMIVFYMIMVYPSERQRLLREDNVSKSNAIFLDSNVYYIGNGNPSVNFQYNLSNFEIGYPLKDIKLKSEEVSMSANVIKPQIKTYSLVPGNETVGYKVFIEVDSIDGAIYLISGHDVIKEITSPGTYEIKVPGTFSIKFSHKGFAFWRTQHTKFKITIYEQYYDDSKADFKINIPINLISGEYVGIKINAVGEGPVEILLNGEKIFYGELMNETETEIQIPISEVNLKTNNVLEFVSSKGADYTINNFTFYLFSGPAPSLSKTYFIEPINSTVKVGIKVRVINPGILSIAIMPKGTVFFIGKDAVQNGWNYFIVNESFMNEAHGIKVFSVDGRFEIQQFKIVKVS